MNKAAYKGYEIIASPHPLTDRKWDVNLNIRKEGGMKFTNFTADPTFNTREEAIQECFNFGRKIIETKIQDGSIGNLE
jgi:hypothetical protein